MSKSLPKPQLWQIFVLSSRARGLWSNSSSSLPEVWLSFGAEILAGVLVVCWAWREGCAAGLRKVKALRSLSFCFWKVTQSCSQAQECLQVSPLCGGSLPEL